MCCTMSSSVLAFTGIHYERIEVVSVQLHGVAVLAAKDLSYYLKFSVQEICKFINNFVVRNSGTNCTWGFVKLFTVAKSLLMISEEYAFLAWLNSML